MIHARPVAPFRQTIRAAMQSNALPKLPTPVFQCIPAHPHRSASLIVAAITALDILMPDILPLTLYCKSARVDCESQMWVVRTPLLMLSQTLFIPES